MSMRNKPESILTHGGGSLAASLPPGHMAVGKPDPNKPAPGIAATLAGNHDHHQEQHEYLFDGAEKPEPSDYPRHVHSKKVVGEYIEVETADQHKAAIDSGEWSDTPLEDKGKDNE